MNDQFVWYQGIREIHERYLYESWDKRADAINERYCLTDAHMLLTHGPGIPMPWFNGDIEAIEPGNWVLVISLNHQLDRDGFERLDHQANAISLEEAWWRQRRRMNTDRWYGQFFGPLARVAATALGEQLQREDEPEFATNRMIFVEICPYASNKFNMDWRTVADLLKTDLGFQLAADVNQLLIHGGDPALVMINGGSAIAMVEHLYAETLDWEEDRYESCDPPRAGRKPKALRHFCGSIRRGEKSTPVIGFPFLRTPSTHNSNIEVALLGEKARHCLRSQRWVCGGAPDVTNPLPCSQGEELGLG